MPYMYVPKPNFFNSPLKKKIVFEHSKLQTDKIIHFCYGLFVIYQYKTIFLALLAVVFARTVSLLLL